MTKSLAITCAGILAVCLLGSCSTERDPRDLLAPGGIGVPVIDALLVVGQPLPDIFLTRTIAPDETFNTTRALIARAHVVVTDVAAGTDVIYGYSETTGRYIAPTSPFPTLVEPNTEYRIAITTQEGETLTASTVTPPSLAVADWLLLDDQGQSTRRTLRGFGDFESSDSVYIAPENQIVYGSGILEARLARPDVPAFQIGLHSLDLDSDFVIDPDFFDEEDFEDLDRVTSSPPLAAEDGAFRLPWFAIYFEGRYVVRIFAMDRNWFDLARSVPALSQGGPGFGGNAGDDFQRPIFHVEGGIGLFGSAAVDSIGFVVRP